MNPGTAAQFADVVKRLNGRRLPILIHSPGGSVPDAAAMGELIRARGLAVAVARTLITNCPEAAPKCPDGPGAAITGGATCASACVLVLAGGVERLARPSAGRGAPDHDNGERDRGRSPSHLDAEDLRAARRRRRGRGLSRRHGRGRTGDDAHAQDAWAASIRWLSLAELKDSRLATVALDPADPILASGSNGLNAKAFDGDPPRRRSRAREPRGRFSRGARRGLGNRVPLSSRRRDGRSRSGGARRDGGR